jgi:enamine deaminase RidA (YjgF/YER057c/UK114 family)
MNLPLLRCFAAFFIASVFATTLQAAETSRIERNKVDADIGYSEVVRAGDYVYISGNVGWGAMPDAVKIAYDSLEKLLKENGLTFADVVKENVYTTDLEALKAARGIRSAYYAGIFPAATWVQVDRLYNEGIVIEVELIAYAPVKK